MTKDNRRGTIYAARWWVAIVDYLDDVGLNVARRPGRSAVSAFGTTLAVGIFVFAVAMASSASVQVQREFDLRRATIVRVSGQIETERMHDSGLDEDIKALPGVIEAGRRWTVGDFQITPSDTPWAVEARDVPVRAISQGILDIADSTFTGDAFTPTDFDSAVAAVVIGQATASDFATPIFPGSRIRIGGRTFVVRGLLTDTEVASDSLFEVMVPWTTAARIWPSTMASPELWIRTEIGVAASVASNAPYVVDSAHPERVVAILPPEPENLRQAVTSSLDELLVALAASLLVVSLFGIANSTLAGVLERRFEIGLRRAIGSTRRGIAAMILGETILTGLLASLVGLVLALGAAVLFSTGRGWIPVLPSYLAGLAVGVGVAVGLIAGVVPAIQATRLQPVDALRR